jgi:hypothetical protein
MRAVNSIALSQLFATDGFAWPRAGRITSPTGAVLGENAFKTGAFSDRRVEWERTASMFEIPI